MALTNSLSRVPNTWKAYDQWIEQNADQAAYKAASPENALVLIGPNRAPSGTELANLIPIGLLQNFTIGQNINWVAQQMIGSGRTFFLAGKAPGNGSISRLFTSSSTLLGAIYQQVVTTVGQDAISKFESPAYDKTNSKIMFTLDSEILKIPVGMAVFFRDTVKNFIGGFYVENLVIPNLSMGFAVGQPAIFETVNVIFDRVVPFDRGNDLVTGNIQTEFDKSVSATI
jgi:hypothetical protein